MVYPLEKRKGIRCGRQTKCTRGSFGNHWGFRKSLSQLTDNSMDRLCQLEIIQKVESIIFDLKPEVIYTHHVGDLNVDVN